MSYVDDLLDEYRRFVVAALAAEPRAPHSVCGWPSTRPSTNDAFGCTPRFRGGDDRGRHGWSLIESRQSFERWMASHEYRDDVLRDRPSSSSYAPSVLRPPRCRGPSALAAHPDPDGVVALLGAGTLFGLGDAVKVSALLNAVNDAIAGRLLVFFPGEHEGNSYRLLDARDGWNYLATTDHP